MKFDDRNASYELFNREFDRQTWYVCFRFSSVSMKSFVAPSELPKRFSKGVKAPSARRRRSKAPPQGTSRLRVVIFSLFHWPATSNVHPAWLPETVYPETCLLLDDFDRLNERLLGFLSSGELRATKLQEISNIFPYFFHSVFFDFLSFPFFFFLFFFLLPVI